MKIDIHLDKDDRGTPMELAYAIICHYMDQCRNEEMLMSARESLKAISEHIDVYLRHQIVDVSGCKCKED